MELLIKLLPYYFMGYAGSALHFLLKLPKGITFKQWRSDNLRDVIIAILCYHVILFLWYDTTMFEFFGMIKGVFTGMTVLAGYAGNSLIVNLLGKFDNKIETWKNQKNGTLPQPPTP